MTSLQCGLVLVLAVMLAGCDEPAPETRLIFPPTAGFYEGDAITLRGQVRFNAADRVAITVEGRALMSRQRSSTKPIRGRLISI